MSNGADDGYSEGALCTCVGLPRYYKKHGDIWICEDCGKEYISEDEPREIKR